MPGNAVNSRESTMPEVTLVDAVNLALGRAMEDDPNVVVLGEEAVTFGHFISVPNHWLLVVGTSGMSLFCAGMNQ